MTWTSTVSARCCNHQAGRWSNGKLAQAVRLNHLLVPGTPDEPGPEDEAKIPVTESYTYDGVGGRINAVRRDVAIGGTPRFDHSLSYDALGNVTSRTYPTCSDAQPLDDDVLFCPQANVFRTVSQEFTQGALTSVPGYAPRITYHPNGLVRRVEHENGVAWHQARDPDDMARPLQLRTTGASEDLNTGPFRYDGAGNVTKIGQSNFVYDRLSRLVQGEARMVPDACPDSETVQFLTLSGSHTFENCGPLAAQATTVTSTGDVALRSGERVVLGDGFRVEAGGRLVAGIDASIEPETEVSQASWSGAYDRFGNLTEITTQRPGQSANTRTPVTDPATNCLPKVGTAYDVAGNVVARPGWSYSYDPFGMLRRANEWAMVYGPGDERIWLARRPNPDDESTFLDVWTLRDLSGRPLRQYTTLGGNADGNWNLLNDHVWRGGALLATERGDTTLHHHPDHLGTPRLVTTSDGTTHAYHAYFPFGEQATDAFSIELQYTGHERDPLDTGGTTADLDYMHARYFSAHLGRFQSVDPVGGAPGSPQSWNRYSYVLGNPVKYTDPYGLQIFEVVDEISVVAAPYKFLPAWHSIPFRRPDTLNSTPYLPFVTVPFRALTTPTWDPVSDTRISELHPCAQARARALVNLAEDQLDLTLRISSGFRSFRDQAREFAKGRTAPGNIVTYARPGQSYHNYGLAIDVAPIIGGRLDYNIGWNSVGAIGENLGFDWGGRWNNPDRPHFQLTLGRSTSQLQALTSQQLQALSCP